LGVFVECARAHAACKSIIRLLWAPKVGVEQIVMTDFWRGVFWNGGTHDIDDQRQSARCLKSAKDLHFHRERFRFPWDISFERFPFEDDISSLHFGGHGLGRQTARKGVI